jgi:hypothetical protein
MTAIDEIEDSVRQAVKGVPHLHNLKLGVEVQNHSTNAIILEGVARCYYHKQLAQEAARTVIKRLDVDFRIVNLIRVVD